MSNAPGKRVETISDGGAPPYGDVVNSPLQDNAYKLGFESAGAPDLGHTNAGAQRAEGNPEPTPPGANRPLAGQHRASFAVNPGAVKVVD